MRVPPDKIQIQNIMSPNHVQSVDRAKYESMRSALLAVVPSRSPGVTVAQAKGQLLSLLPDELFPAGAKAGWWLKAVQLDLEAKGVIVREPGSPVRLRTSGNGVEADA
jgi:hypothetical protein